MDHLPAKMSKTSGKPRGSEQETELRPVAARLRIEFLNFYHLSNHLILPMTKCLCQSLSEWSN